MSACLGLWLARVLLAVCLSSLWPSLLRDGQRPGWRDWFSGGDSAGWSEGKLTWAFSLLPARPRLLQKVGLSLRPAWASFLDLPGPHSLSPPLRSPLDPLPPNAETLSL